MKSIKNKLLIMFIMIFIPFIVTIVIAFNTFQNMEDDGVAINLSGSQRMRTIPHRTFNIQFGKVL